MTTPTPEQPPAAPVVAPAGWYPDPSGIPGMVRYWDGRAWGEWPVQGNGALNAPQDQLGLWAVVTSVAGLVLGFSTGVGFILAPVGLVLSILGLNDAKKKNFRSSASIIGLLVSIATIVLAIMAMMFFFLLLVLSMAHGSDPGWSPDAPMSPYDYQYSPDSLTA